MREIKFRGLGVDGKWWYGEIKPQGENHINLATFFANLHAGAIKPETVGEWTGFKNKEGKEIYEGDIATEAIVLGLRGKVIWAEIGAWMVYYGYDEDAFVQEALGNLIVVGNIYENPELLKEEI